MKFSVSTGNTADLKGEVIVIFVTSNWKKEISFLKTNIFEHIGKYEDFSGREKQSITADMVTGNHARVVLLGIEKADYDTAFNLQTLIALSAQKISAKRKRIVFVLPQVWFSRFGPRVLAKLATEAISLATYSYVKYKKKPVENNFENAEVIFNVTPAYQREFRLGVIEGDITASATIYARDLVNEPGNVVNPTYLANRASEIAKKVKGVSVKVYEKGEIAKMGMGAFLGVSQGSEEPPKFLRLEYKPQKSSGKTLVLVGKGITFDTGGLSLKPATSMETMKIDMAGAASVLGVFSQIDKIAPQTRVVGLIATCENMPSGAALRPGDIVTAMNGTTIEVLNTDAEGRLTLADALSFAVKNEKPSAIVDLATLTGAMVVALGEEITGVFGNNSRLVSDVMKAALESGELVWEMPLPEIYKKEVKSTIADLRNISVGRYGGAITAALFLQEFVGKVPWVHMDIAGPAYAEKNIPLAKVGGTGFGVRTLITLLKEFGD